jgi:hypothetical protein
VTVRSANTLLADAARLVVAAQVASPTRLQQQLHMEPAATESLLDALHNAGIVGPAALGLDREVRFGPDQIDAALRHLQSETAGQPSWLLAGWLDPHLLDGGSW